MTIPNKQTEPATSLTDQERVRYERQLLLEEWCGQRGQLKLRNSRVLVIGAGGSGSALLYHLAAAGIGDIRVCDGAAFELSDLSQLILADASSIGKNKAQAAAEVITRINPDVLLALFPEHVSDDNISSMGANCDLICCTAPGSGPKKTLGRFAFERGIPFIVSGTFHMSGHMTFIEPPSTPCIDCILNASDRVKEEYKSGKLKISKEDAKILSEEKPRANIGPAAGIVGSLQAMEAIKFLVGFGTNLLGVMLRFKLGGMGMSFTLNDIDGLRRKECHICGQETHK